MDANQILKRSLDAWAEDLNGDMELDKYKLDDQCAQQTSVYSKWALISAKASRERDYRQKELDEEVAKLDNEVRVNPEKFGIKDIKENAVKAVIASDKIVMKLKTDVIEATTYAKFFNSAVSACDQKKTMLRELGDLWLGEYYSNVEIKKGEVDDNLRVKMRERKGGSKRSS